MSLLYTELMRREIHSLQKPPGFVMDVVDKGDHLTLRVYQNEILNLKHFERLAAMAYLNTVEGLIKNYNVNCYIEGAPGDPRREL
jgi:hypothetical protein